MELQTQELKLIEPSKAEKIKQTFEPMADMLESFESDYNDILKQANKEITSDLTQKAKRLRIDIGKVRIETGKLKDKQKEYIKLEDKAIMGVHNILVWAVKEKEDKLKEIENHFERLEEIRLKNLQDERVYEISMYLEDANERDLSSMDEDVWAAYFSSKKKAYEDRLEAEKKAEAERVRLENEEKKERERIKKENERLKKEAEIRAKEEEKRRAKEEAERKRIAEIEAKKQAELQAKLKAEKEAKAKIEREERIKREKLEAELKAKEEVERKRIAEIEAKKQAELQKGDADKVKDLIYDLSYLKSKYIFKSNKNKKMYSDVCILIEKIKIYIKTNY